MELPITVIFCIVALVCIKVFEKIYDYKSKLEEIEMELSIERSKRHIAEIDNYAMRMQLNAMQGSNHYSSNRDVLDAVKYAMTKAHPDNGGKQEDFIKFRQVYEKLK